MKKTLSTLSRLTSLCFLVVCANVSAQSAPASASSASTSASGAGRASVAIRTIAAKNRDFDIQLESIGTVTATAIVDIKPQTSSPVTHVHVKEGQFVKKGDLLFTLDGRADEANVAKIRAQMTKDAALLADAQRQLVRSKELIAKGFVSQGAVDTIQAQVDSQQANLLADKAALDAAQLALSYTRVRAPSAGRLGVINAFVGTSVLANQTAMVSLTQLNPINVSFNLPQSTLPTLLAGLKDGNMLVTAQLPDSPNAPPLKGRLQFVDSMVDAATGTIKARASFDNTQSTLWPGAFVKMQLRSQTLRNAVVIPTVALIYSPKGTMVYVADNGKAVARPVKVLASQAEESAVSGVEEGSKVIVEGRQNLRPDTPVIERAK
jgi:RND family efflux transporter MFP subunit